MGVRFECPNGHRLNVKSDLAGKRGICPECNVRFVVPAESGGRAQAVESAVASTGATMRFESSGQAASIGSTAEPRRPQAAANTAAPAPTANPSKSASAPVSAAAPASAAVDAWYVRPATGGQFGPATTEMFHKWVAEGRVPPDSWVWRDGWTDWKGAREALADLTPPKGIAPAASTIVISAPASAGSAPVVAASPVIATSSVATVAAGAPSVGAAATPEQPGDSPAAVARRAKLARRRQRNKQITIALGIVVLVLVSVLGVVLSK